MGNFHVFKMPSCERGIDRQYCLPRIKVAQAATLLCFGISVLNSIIFTLDNDYARIALNAAVFFLPIISDFWPKISAIAEEANKQAAERRMENPGFGTARTAFLMSNLLVFLLYLITPLLINTVKEETQASIQKLESALAFFIAFLPTAFYHFIVYNKASFDQAVLQEATPETEALATSSSPPSTPVRRQNRSNSGPHLTPSSRLFDQSDRESRKANIQRMVNTLSTKDLAKTEDFFSRLRSASSPEGSAAATASAAQGESKEDGAPPTLTLGQARR